MDEDDLMTLMLLQGEDTILDDEDVLMLLLHQAEEIEEADHQKYGRFDIDVSIRKTSSLRNYFKINLFLHNSSGHLTIVDVSCEAETVFPLPTI